MAKKRESKQPDLKTMSFEQATAELEAIIERIEQGDVGLEESLAERRRGELLIKRCRAVLDAAEQELKQVSVEEASPDESGRNA